MTDTFDVRIGAPELTKEMIDQYIGFAKALHFKYLTFTYESFVGPYLTIDLDDEP